MRKLFSIALLTVSILFLNQASTAAAFDNFKEALRVFESSIKFEAQSDSWKRQRASWLATLRNARSGQMLTGKLLLQLETSIKYSMQSDSWRSIRPGWIAGIKSTRMVRELVPYILQLEQLAKWQAHYPWWKQKRNQWRATVRAIR